jgi:4-hydroxy-3-methylbut-2-enyl diphosphate reductase
MLAASPKPRLKILLAAPRGFCAGVERAIQIVERALAKWGAPVYVRHEIVHNRFVVESLEAKGAVFVAELDAVPDDRPVIFSAHGVPKSVPAAARSRAMTYVDATCPLVSKVHHEAERHFAAGHHIVLIGHAGHPEVIGTIGQLPVGAVTLVETVADVTRFEPPPAAGLAYVTQTTLSVDDTAAIAAALRMRFPGIVGPRRPTARRRSRNSRRRRTRCWLSALPIPPIRVAWSRSRPEPGVRAPCSSSARATSTGRCSPRHARSASPRARRRPRRWWTR